MNIDLQALAQILALLGVPAAKIPLILVGMFIFCGICAHLAAVLPQANAQSSTLYKAFSSVLAKFAGNYLNAKNMPTVATMAASPQVTAAIVQTVAQAAGASNTQAQILGTLTSALEGAGSVAVNSPSTTAPSKGP